ncbi:hypothetical protein SUGI_0529950 [Cryptomeria japonica]|nr:hypothetical protein SUGI_0529950 [Cryptomeria japonica]
MLEMMMWWLLLLLFSLQLCSAQDLQKQFLDPHNRARSHVGVRPLVWDSTLAAYAQNYANQRKADCAWKHSGGPYGENLFWGRGKEFSPADAVGSWVNQKQYYNYAQVVSRSAQKVGCAHVKCKNDAIFIICNYNPPGNVIAQMPHLTSPFAPVSSF